jgi:hypothetical protein
MENEQLIVTEVRIKGERDRQVLPRAEIQRLLDKESIEAVYKFVPCERTVPDGRPRRRFIVQGKFLAEGRPVASAIITSSAPDRDGDVVNANGAQLDSYLANPVVLPMHIKTFPIGFAEELRVYGDRIWAQWQWLTDQPDTEAAVYQRLWDAYVLNATSIGFLPRAVRENESGWIYDRWEMIEFSPVVIPANSDAMRTNSARDVLDSYGEMVFSSGSPVMKSLWISGEARERPKQVTGIALDAHVDEETVVETVETKDAVSESATKQADVELRTLEDAKVAFAAGVISPERLLEFVEGYVQQLRTERDEAVAEVEALRSQAAALAATVVVRR